MDLITQLLKVGGIYWNICRSVVIDSGQWRCSKVPINGFLMIAKNFSDKGNHLFQYCINLVVNQLLVGDNCCFKLDYIVT